MYISKNYFFLSVLSSLIYFTSCSKEEFDISEIDSTLIIHTEIANRSAKLASRGFHWKNWYLSVPIKNNKNKATSIFYQDLESGNFTREQKKYVTKNADGSYTFNTRYTEYTTSGKYPTNTKGKYCRTELREFYRGNKDTKDNWSMKSGTHLMESTMIVDYCQGNSKTFVGQIHGYGDNSPATVKVAWDNGMIKLEYYTKPESGRQWTSKYIKKTNLTRVDGAEFTIGIRVVNGVLSCSVKCPSKGIDTGYKTFYNYKKNGYAKKYTNYFKTGNYFNWNKDKSKTCQVTMLGIHTEHNSNNTVSDSDDAPTPVPNEDNTNSKQLISNGKYSLLSPYKNEGLTSYNGYNGNVKMTSRKTKDNSQKWEITHLGNNIYTLKNLHTKRYLEVQRSKCQNSANVGTEISADKENQKWKIEKNDGYYILKANHCDTRAIDRENGESNANAQIYWYNDSNDNQKWKIKKQ